MLERTRVYLVLFFSLGLAAASGVQAQDGGGITPEVVWTYETGGPVWGSSTTRDGVVYFGSTDGSVHALAVRTGEQVWSVETDGAIYASVSVYDDYLYASSDDGYLYKLALADGAEIWKANLHEAEPIERQRPADGQDSKGWDFRGSSAREVDGHVYVGSADRRLYALDAETGDKVWHFATGHRVRSTPAVTDSLVVVGSFDGLVYALDRATGEERWRFNTGGTVSTSPVVHDSLVYIGSRSTRLYALSLASGRAVWTKPYGNGSWVESTGVVYDETLYIGSSFWSTQLAVNPETGASYWQSSTGGAAYSTPALTDEAHYSGTVGLANTLSGDMRGALVRLDRATGRIDWKFPFQVVPGEYDHGVAATPEVVDGLVLFGALDGVFYALEEKGSAGGEVQINQFESFDDVGILGSWKNTTAGSYALTTVTDDKVEGAAAARLDYVLVADLDWGGSIDVQGIPAEGTFDFSGAAGLAMHYKIVQPADNPSNVSFVFKLVDESTGVQEFWEQSVPSVLGDASGEWLQMRIPMDGFAIPSWAAQGDGTLDLDQITEWQFQVIASGMGVGTTTTGAFLFDRLGTYGASGVGREEGAAVPAAYVLHQNYPNPFNPSTLIRYELSEPAHVALRVFNVMGQEVAVLFDGVAQTGVHDVRFDASALPSGVYYYQIRTGNVVEGRPMMLVR